MRCKNTLVLFLFFAVLISISSCGEKKISDVIVGAWEVKEVNINDSEVSPDLITYLKSEMLSSTYTFHDGGGFELQSNIITKGVKGKWKAMDDKKELYTEYFANDLEYKTTYQIEIVDESTIIFRQEFGSSLGNMEATLIKK
jgi:hypothetical protein